MATKKTSKADHVEHANGSFTKIDINGRRVLSDHLMPGEKRLNDTTDVYLANVPTDLG